jgi:hypothetical protein
MTFARGAFAMARMSGAEVVPVVGLWTPTGRIRILVGEPLVFSRGETAEAFDTNGAAEFARWYERVMLSDPSQLRVEVMHRFLAAPRMAPESI